MANIVEKIIDSRLRWFLKKNNILDSRRNGFRRDRSTTNTLHDIQQEIYSTLEEKHLMGLVSLDISKAYDITWCPRILKILLKIICNAINDIPLFIQPPVKCTLFADDFNIFCRGTNSNRTKKHLLEAILALQAWTYASGFSFSAEKSQFIIFTNKRNIGNTSITMNNIPISIRKSIKILGILFDSRNTYIPHLKTIRNGLSYKNEYPIMSGSQIVGKSLLESIANI
ncbi:Reverse transcriptase domain [Cinara cedri]|uniref:Reverse transcriptase domain n=1 Tax=Cinara cedri TaxID=506608 RepID=A0A5E4M5S0_9HEMI|nr:Reverse transcriptase domain [Cinara cedri]